MNYFHFLFTTILRIMPEILPASLQNLVQLPLGTFENIKAEAENYFRKFLVYKEGIVGEGMF